MRSSKLTEWARNEIRAVFYSETSRGATPLAHNRAAWKARKAEKRAVQLEKEIRNHGVDPYEKLRNGEIK